MKNRFGKSLVCLALAFGSLAGVCMSPEEIEQLLWTMNKPVMETTIPDDSDKEDPLKKELRERGVRFD